MQGRRGFLIGLEAKKDVLFFWFCPIIFCVEERYLYVVGFWFCFYRSAFIKARPVLTACFAAGCSSGTWRLSFVFIPPMEPKWAHDGKSFPLRCYCLRYSFQSAKGFLQTSLWCRRASPRLPRICREIPSPFPRVRSGDGLCLESTWCISTAFPEPTLPGPRPDLAQDVLCKNKSSLWCERCRSAPSLGWFKQRMLWPEWFKMFQLWLFLNWKPTEALSIPCSSASRRLNFFL